MHCEPHNIHDAWLGLLPLNTYGLVGKGLHINNIKHSISKHSRARGKMQLILLEASHEKVTFEIFSLYGIHNPESNITLFSSLYLSL